MRHKLFTKRFFKSSPCDQGKIVDAVIHNLEQAAMWDDSGRIKAKIRRITRKAIKYGIYAESEGGHEIV